VTALLAAVVFAACGCESSGSGGATPDAGSASGGSGGTGGPDTVMLMRPDGGATDAGGDAGVASGIDAGPPPEAPPFDDARVVHVLLERGGQVHLARVAPEAGYVGAFGEPLPIAPADLDDTAIEVWSRDEGPRAVVDFGDLGVYASEGGPWAKLGDAPPDPVNGPVTQRFFAVSSDVDRVLLGYTAYDMMTFNYTLTGALWSTGGDEVFSFLPTPGANTASTVFDAEGTLFTVREPMGVAVREAVDGSLVTHLPQYQDVFALFRTSYLVGNPPYLNWLDFMGNPVVVPNLPMLPGGTSWRVAEIDGVWHTAIDGELYRLGDREAIEVWPLPPGMTAASVLGYTDGGILVGEVSEKPNVPDAGAPDAGVGASLPMRAYVALNDRGVEQERFAPAASVVEEDDSIVDAAWERRARAKAWSITGDRAAVAFEVQHTYWRGAWGQIAALTDDLWVIDGEGARTSRPVQVPYVPGAKSPMHGQRKITADGRWYVWTHGADVYAMSLDSFEAVLLREAF
jgi:hypothetical protein